MRRGRACGLGGGEALRDERKDEQHDADKEQEHEEGAWYSHRGMCGVRIWDPGSYFKKNCPAWNLAI